MKSRIVFGTLALLTTSLASAQSEKGNGGRVWVCFGPADPKTRMPSVESAQFADFKNLVGSNPLWHIDLGEDREGIDDTEAMIEVALKRLDRLDHIRTEKIRSKVEEILSYKNRNDIDLETAKATLQKRSDGQYNFEPFREGCKEVQGGFSNAYPDKMQYEFVFVKQFLEKMPDPHRAGFFLHEAIRNLEATGYGGLAKTTAPDSEGTQAMTVAICSKELESWSPRQFHQWVRNPGRKERSVLNSITAKNGSFLAPQFLGKSSDTLSEGTAHETRTYEFHGMVLKNQTPHETTYVQTPVVYPARVIIGAKAQATVISFFNQAQPEVSVPTAGMLEGGWFRSSLRNLWYVTGRPQFIGAESIQLTDVEVEFKTKPLPEKGVTGPYTLQTDGEGRFYPTAHKIILMNTIKKESYLNSDMAFSKLRFSMADGILEILNSTPQQTEVTLTLNPETARIQHAEFALPFLGEETLTLHPPVGPELQFKIQTREINCHRFPRGCRNSTILRNVLQLTLDPSGKILEAKILEKTGQY